VGAVVASLRSKLPMSPILLLGIFPRDEKPGTPFRQKITEANTGLAKLADGRHVHFLDISTAFTEADGSLSKEVMPDFLHLSPLGYERWATAMKKPLAQLLTAKP
jgi:lysophospholipase L1-like esterase